MTEVGVEVEAPEVAVGVNVTEEVTEIVTGAGVDSEDVEVALWIIEMIDVGPGARVESGPPETKISEGKLIGSESWWRTYLHS